VATLSERLDSAIAEIDNVFRDPAVPADMKELLIDLRSLLLDEDHARRHYRRATRLAAVEFSRLCPGETLGAD
jgi:hypothetical protein